MIICLCLILFMFMIIVDYCLIAYVNNWLNDIFGTRIILSSHEILSIMNMLDDWHDELNLKNWYLRDKEGYRGLHIYFKNKSNYYFPWELQVWGSNDLQSNIQNYEKCKRNFI